MAVFSQVLITILAYLGLNLFGETWLGSSLLFGLIGALGVGVILPLYWMVVIRERELKEVGITGRNWLVSLLISLVLGGLLFWQYYSSFGISAPTIPALFVVAYTLWEVIFVCGWLQLRFEEAFGIIPGVILAGLCFSLYHLGYGWYDLPGLVGLFGAGVFMAIAFRFTRNILILWPFLWPVGCLQGFKMGGFSPDWSGAVFSGVELVLLLISIFIFYRIQKRRAILKKNNPTSPDSG
jgi:membrane protease YdiL (CAAX protease family)